jgi:hypothetical protein
VIVEKAFNDGKSVAILTALASKMAARVRSEGGAPNLLSLRFAFWLLHSLMLATFGTSGSRPRRKGHSRQAHVAYGQERLPFLPGLCVCAMDGTVKLPILPESRVRGRKEPVR